MTVQHIKLRSGLSRNRGAARSKKKAQDYTGDADYTVRNLDIILRFSLAGFLIVALPAIWSGWRESLYIIFGLQALLAWIISIPLLYALAQPAEIGLIEITATAIWLIGFLFEATADQQLYRFKSDPDNKDKVLDTGLWAYSRHPNYFGEFLIWWSYFLFAFTAGGWWTVFSPLLMTLLLLKVSGVSLMEKGITERRSQYRDYIHSTNAFFPGKPRNSKVYLEGGQQS